MLQTAPHPTPRPPRVVEAIHWDGAGAKRIHGNLIITIIAIATVIASASANRTFPAAPLQLVAVVPLLEHVVDLILRQVKHAGRTFADAVVVVDHPEYVYFHRVNAPFPLYGARLPENAAGAIEPCLPHLGAVPSLVPLQRLRPFPRRLAPLSPLCDSVGDLADVRELLVQESDVLLRPVQIFLHAFVEVHLDVRVVRHLHLTAASTIGIRILPITAGVFIIRGRVR